MTKLLNCPFPCFPTQLFWNYAHAAVSNHLGVIISDIIFTVKVVTLVVTQQLVVPPMLRRWQLIKINLSSDIYLFNEKIWYVGKNGDIKNVKYHCIALFDPEP